MTIIDTTLYANGALRLSRHGAGKGGNVLVHEYADGETEQLDVPGDLLDLVERSLKDYDQTPIPAGTAFDGIRRLIKTYTADAKPTASPGWYHN